MKLSAKQFAMAFVNSQLDETKVRLEKSDLEVFNPGQEISDKLFEEAVKHIKSEISKLKPKFAYYVQKYCSVETTNSIETQKADTTTS